jgi:GH24 family phage-related lysozyme (muramidase)
MYLDTVGVVTVGIGTALFSAADAQKLAFVKRGTATAASDAEIETDWKEVHKQTKGLLATSYKKFTKLDLPADAIAKAFKDELSGFEDKLKAKWSNFNDFPKPAQLALLDMMYNLGSLDGFPSLSKAVDKQDWETCAKECHRKGPSETRNKETKELFEKAAKLAKESRRRWRVRSSGQDGRPDLCANGRGTGSVCGHWRRCCDRGCFGRTAGAEKAVV